MSNQNLPSCDLQPLIITVDLMELSWASTIWDWKVGGRERWDRKEENQDQYIKTMLENSLLEQHKEEQPSLILFAWSHKVIVEGAEGWWSLGLLLRKLHAMRKPSFEQLCSLASGLSVLSNCIWTGTELKIYCLLWYGTRAWQAETFGCCIANGLSWAGCR